MKAFAWRELTAAAGVVWSKAWPLNEDSAIVLTESERSRADWMMRLNLRRAENVYFQYEQGLVDASALGSYGLQNLQNGGTYRGRRFAEYWGRNRAGFSPSFVKFFEGRMQYADSVAHP